MRRLGRTSWPLLLLVACGAWVYAPLLSGQLLAGRDLWRLFIPDAAYLRERLLQGELPLWNPGLRLGQPFLATFQSQVLDPLRVVPVLVFGAARGVTVEQLLHVAVAFLGTRFSARRMGASRRGATLAGLLFALGPLPTMLASQQNVSGAAAFSGFIAAFALGLGRRPSWVEAAGLALAVTLSTLAGSPETVVWQCGMAVVLFTAAAPRQRRLRAFTLGSAALAWGACGAAAVLLPVGEFALQSQRLAGAVGVLVWSLGWSDLVAMALPGANLPAHDYWQDQSYFPVLYQGVVALALVPLALHGSQSRRRAWPIAAVAVLALLLALGEHFPPAAWLIEGSPLRAFRYPVKYVVGACFALSLLAGLGLDRAAALAARRGPRAGRAIGAAATALVIAGSGAFGAHALGLRAGFAPALGSAVALLAVAAAVFWASPKLPRRARAVGGVLFALAVLDAVSGHGLERPFALPAADLERASEVAAAIPLPRTWPRVTLDPAFLGEWTDAPVSAAAHADAYLASTRPALMPNRFLEEGLRSIDGYGAPEPARWEQVMDLNEAPARELYDLLGVGWYVWRGAPPAGLETVLPPQPSPVHPLLSRPGLYRSATVQPRAFWVREASVVDDAEALSVLQRAPQRLRLEVLLAPGAPAPPAPPPPCEGSSVTVTGDGAEAVELEAFACAAGWVVVTDAWYPGWRATVDGADAPLWRADHLVRAVPVPAGHHRVAMRYQPGSFRLGAALSLAAWALLAGVGLWRVRRRLHLT